MKETRFIEQNKEKWRRFERLSQSETKDPDELSSLYMDITDDLSYAQTFYNRRTVRAYLNQLAQKVYTSLHIQKGESLKKFLTVWKVSLPLEIYRARKNLLFALIVFFVWAGIGVISTKNDPDFARKILGDGYVDMTNENIAKGKPLHVYKIEDYRYETNTTMFITITSNNLRVAFFCYILGIFFTIGTHILLFQNSIMVGTFQYFFATKGLLLTSFLGIWIHGAFEISAIVLSAGAGITLGNGLLFPKNYTRLQSLQLSAKRSIKIMLSLVPFIIMAGFLESFVTANYQDLPEWSKWFLILFCFGIIIFVYVIYPSIVARKYPHLVNDEEIVAQTPDTGFVLEKIRSLGEIISDSFRFFTGQFAKFSKINLFITLPLCLILMAVQINNHIDLMFTNHYYDWAKQLEIMMGFGYTNWIDYLVNFLWTFIVALVFLSISFAFNTLNQVFSWRAFFVFMWRRFLAIWVCSLMVFYLLSLPYWMWYFLILFLIPFIYLQPVLPGILDKSYFRGFGLSWSYSVKSYGNSLLTIMVFVLILGLFAQPIAFVGSIYEGSARNEFPDLLDITCNLIKRICDKTAVDGFFISNIFRQIVYICFLLFLVPLWFISMFFLAYNEHEKETANGLKKAFQLFGKRSKVKETESDYA